MRLCASGCHQGPAIFKPGSHLLPEFPDLCSTGVAGKNHLDLTLRLEFIRLSAAGKCRERSLLSADVYAAQQEKQDLFQKEWQSPPTAYVQDKQDSHSSDCIARSESATHQSRQPE